MTVSETSLRAYYKLVLSGEDEKQRHRIMRHILTVGKPVTRHEIVDRYFCVHPGPVALDDGKPIPWQSATARISELVDNGYVDNSRTGECPVTGSESELLTPVIFEDIVVEGMVQGELGF